MVKLILGWMLADNHTGPSRDFSEVRPVLAAGGWLAYFPEPRAESLETDLGTYVYKTQLLWMLQASQANRGAGVVTEDVVTGEHRFPPS